MRTGEEGFEKEKPITSRGVRVTRIDLRTSEIRLMNKGRDRWVRITKWRSVRTLVKGVRARC